jgi:hypothetical protein
VYFVVTNDFAFRPSDFGFPSDFGLRISTLVALLLAFAAQAADPSSTRSPSGTLTNAPSSSRSLTPATVLRDASALAALMASLDDTKKLGPGDKITYRVLEDQDETMPLTVSDAGDVDVPYLGLLRPQRQEAEAKQSGLPLEGDGCRHRGHRQAILSRLVP